ncbi:MAG: iron ABC transporter substrate-binding protein, partial [Roseomonas sp.]|nr:iron ABC transporter substrate-binding protein [Roseomonas sp.]
MIKRVLGFAAAFLLGATGPVWAQGSLNLYCSATIEWCQPIARGFERETGIRVTLAQKSTGEMLAQLR